MYVEEKMEYNNYSYTEKCKIAKENKMLFQDNVIMAKKMMQMMEKRMR